MHTDTVTTTIVMISDDCPIPPDGAKREEHAVKSWKVVWGKKKGMKIQVIDLKHMG